MSFLPKIQAPFGILGDAKLSFRTQPSGIARLADGGQIPPTDAYWAQFWTLFDTTSDVFSLVGINDVRNALINNPANIATLVRVLANHLFTLASDHTFPSQTTGVTMVGNIINSSARNTSKEALNCIRVLSRVFPVIFELDHQELEQQLLWKRETATSEELADPTTESQFVIADDDEDEQTPSTPEPARGKPSTELPGSSIAEKLIACILDLLYCCGFTLPPKIQVDHYKINLTIWEKGVGSTLDPGSSQVLDANKVEVLRLLLVLISRPLYVSPTNLLTRVASTYTAHLVQQSQRRQALTLLCSLLNTAMNNTSASGLASGIPYNHLVWKGEDVRSTLVATSLQVLVALLDYQSDNARDKEVAGSAGPEYAPTNKTNMFRCSIAKLHRSADFEYILQGFLGIFEQEVYATNHILPGSRKHLPYILETIILFWKIIDLNKKFLAYMLESEKSTDLIVYLLCLGLETKDKPQNHGLTRALSYILESISAEPAFGKKMNSRVKARVPGKWAVQGNLADFVVNSIYFMIATTSGQLNSLFPAFVIALSNLSPYFENLNINSSARLVQLLQSFSNPAFLLSDEGHPRLLYFLLEAFNSVIHHKLKENPNVLYGILRSHKVFEDLGTFTLPGALREIRRIQLRKDQQGQAKKNEPREREDVGAEKARLLESEGVESLSLSDNRDLEMGPIDLSSSGTRFEGEEGSLPSSPPNELSDSGDTVTGGGAISQSQSSSQPLSEKARGKQPERSQSVDSVRNENLERFAQAGIGRNGFVPTQEWVTSWQQGLPLDTVLLTVAELLPKVQQLQSASVGGNATSTILNFLKTADLTQVLPAPPPITARRFQWSDASLVWLTSLIWGEIYVKGMSPFGIWSSTNVRLFHVKHSPAQSRQISEALSTVVGGLGGLLGRSTESSSAARTRNAR